MQKSRSPGSGEIFNVGIRAGAKISNLENPTGFLSFFQKFVSTCTRLQEYKLLIYWEKGQASPFYSMRHFHLFLLLKAIAAGGYEPKNDAALRLTSGKYPDSSTLQNLAEEDDDDDWDGAMTPNPISPNTMYYSKSIGDLSSSRLPSLSSWQAGSRPVPWRNILPRPLPVVPTDLPSMLRSTLYIPVNAMKYHPRSCSLEIDDGKLPEYALITEKKRYMYAFPL